MAYKFRWKKKVNATKVAIKIGVTVLGLYVGGVFLDAVLGSMNNTCSPFYAGFKIFGWTLYTGQGNSSVIHYSPNCIGSVNVLEHPQGTSSAGLLIVVGLAAIIGILNEFMYVSMR